MKYQRLLLALILIVLMGNIAYGINLQTFRLHGVVQQIAPETGDDSLTIWADTLYLVFGDTTRFSFSPPYTITFGSGGAGFRWEKDLDEMQFSNDMASWSAIGTSSGMSAADFADSLDDATYLDSTNIANQGLVPEDLDSTDNDFVFFKAFRGTSAEDDSNFMTKKWIDDQAAGMPAADFNDSLESQADFSPNIFNRIDTTTAKIPTATLADSANGGAIRSETSKEADSTDGGAIRSETCKEADSTDGGATRAESAQGLVGKGVNSTDPADGEVLTYYTTGDTLGWTGAGAGDVTDVVGGAGLVDDGNTGAITVDLQIGSWPLDLNADSVWLDSTEIVTWPYWTAAYDSVDNWNNLVNDDRDSVLAFTSIVSEAKDSMTSWANEVNAATDSLTSWANEVNEHTDSIAAWANLVNDDRDSVLAFTSIVSEAKDSLTSWANEVNAATDSLASWANEVNTNTDSVAAWANQVNDNSDDVDELETDTRYIATIYNPNAFWVADSILITIDPRSAAAITVTRIDVTCDADPTTELDFDLMWADARIGNANRAVIDEMNTTSGAVAITTGFDDATVAANKCIYIRFNAEPDADMLEVSVRVTYTID